MYGRGAILRIDLSHEKVTKEPMPAELCRMYIGGEGINSRLLWEHFLKVDPRIDPTGPDNVIIWGLGPLGGTAFGAGSKSRWTFKGPAYNMFADTTSGGAFGPQMRWAGYDHLVITGRAKHPVYIWVNDDVVELRNAGHLWGKKVIEADDAIKQELGDEKVETACIGPGGENMVTYASLTVSRYRSAARTGAGCVFGSKNLKAVAARGTKGIAVYDRLAFYKALDAELAAINQNPKTRETVKKYGTLRHLAVLNLIGCNGYRNGQRGESPDIDKLGGDWYVSHLQQRSLACSPGCAAACQHWHYIKGHESPLAGRYVGQRGQRPEYGMVASLGTNCDIQDLPTVIHLSEICNEYGIDIFEAGLSISFLMELWQRGIITQKDMVEWTGEPLSLEWGNYETMEKVLDSIGHQNNQLGKILSRGVYHAAKRIEELKGVPVLRYALYGKGGATHEQPMSRPQLALAAAVSAIGCHHLKGSGIDESSSIKYFGKPDAGYPFGSVLKGAGQALQEYFCSMYNALGVCRFGGGAVRNIASYPPELYAPALYALTGVEMTAEELVTAGKRIVNIEKAFNSRLGLKREDDSLCYRWMNEPVVDGPGKGTKAGDWLEQAKDEYYEYHGRDKATSLQNRETLEELGLKDVADVLEREGGLA